MPDLYESKSAVIRMTFDIDAPLGKVWNIITSETSLWWDHEFAALPGSQGVKLEPVLGGRIYEETPDGKALEWAKVIAVDPPHSIDFQGIMTPAFGGPTLTTVQLALTEKDGKTVLTMTEGLIGRVTDDTIQSMNEGWNFLFGQKLKTACEVAAREG